MIELTTQGDEKVAVNPALIWQIRQAAGQQTAIYSATGAILFVLEPYAEVLERLEGSGYAFD